LPAFWPSGFKVCVTVGRNVFAQIDFCAQDRINKPIKV